MNHVPRPGEACIIAVDASLPEASRQQLMALHPEVRLVDGLEPENLARAEVIYLGKGRFDPSAAPRLKWVQYASAGIRALRDTALARAGIPVASASGAYSPSVAELAITLLLAIQRRLRRHLELQREQCWRGDANLIRGVSSRGRTLGILGYGSIGREVARLGESLGMRVLACKRHPEVRRDTHFRLPGTGDPDGRIPVGWFGLGELPALLPQVDVLVIALPGSPATDRLIGARELARLPSHGILINVGRGSIVDEPALMEALRAGRLGGAGLDVVGEEPLPSDSPLWSVPNLWITPHVGSDTTDQAERAAEVLMENVRRHLAGEPLLNRVDFAAGY